MAEVFPIVIGLTLGGLVAVRWRFLRRWSVRIALLVVAGVVATVLSGEYVESWAFVLIDTTIVAVSAWAAHAAIELVRSRRPAHVIGRTGYWEGDRSRPDPGI